MNDPNPPAAPEQSHLHLQRFGATSAGANTLGTDSGSEDYLGAAMLYTHNTPSDTLLATMRHFHSPREVLLCSSLDDLMSCMELDCVDEIIFDGSVNSQEMDYLSRWARIFKPSVRCSRHASKVHAAFFSGQQN